MNALRWVVFGAALAAFVLFAIPNWTTVAVNLGATMVDIKLPVLLLLAVLLGWLPMLVVHWAARATWRRRLTKVERAMQEATLAIRPAPAPTPVTAPPPQVGL